LLFIAGWLYVGPSLCSVNVGDKVILCYDERHGHYVVFTLSATQHFLHADSLKEFDQQTSVPDDKARPWLLAEITGKEYCQARKVNLQCLHTMYRPFRSMLWGLNDSMRS
jgi:hypothetical protein